MIVFLAISHRNDGDNAENLDCIDAMGQCKVQTRFGAAQREAGQKINAIGLLDSRGRASSTVVPAGYSCSDCCTLARHATTREIDRLFRTTKFISRSPNSLTLVMAPWNIDAVPLASCESRVKVLSRLRWDDRIQAKGTWRTRGVIVTASACVISSKCVILAKGWLPPIRTNCT
jgi:hypothetical protein